jgi:hypothetical protein
VTSPTRLAPVRPRPRRRSPLSAPRGAQAPPLAVAAVAVVVAAAVALGVVLRVWFVGHEPIDADEAVAGLMARHILAGHANAFFWGQRYGGVEPYLVAAMFWVAGPSVVALRLTPVLLDAAACLLLFLLARHLVARRELAALAAAAMWVAPQSAVWNSTLEYGFRGVTMVCGLALLALTRRAVERDRPGWELAGVGAAAGLGWWSSPEIVYFAIPGGLWLLRWAWVQRRSIGAHAARALSWAGAAVLAAAVGALPWLWDNLTTGFPSLNTASYHVPANSPGYAGRLAVFFKDAVPMALDLRTPGSGAWSIPTPAAVALYAVGAGAVVAAALWCVARRSAGAALAVAVAAFPFLFALIPGSWLWESGRYVNFLVPLVLLLVVVAADDMLSAGRLSTHVAAARRSGRVALAGAVVLVGVGVLGTVNFTKLQRALVPPGVLFGPGGPDAPASALAAALERHGVTEGFADYWIAYKVDFLSGERLRIVPSPPSPDRTPALTARVAAAPARDEAWLFMVPSRFEEVEYHTWGSPVLRGPGGLPEASFLSDLGRLGVRYRVLHLRDVDVVYPSRRVTFAEVGLRPFAP